MERETTGRIGEGASLRSMMLARIEEIKKKEGGFARGRQKWQAFSRPKSIDKGSYVDACDVDFESMDAEDLLEAYTKVMIRYYRQC